MNRKPLTPGEISETLNVSDTSVRNYVKHFQKFLSADATRRTRKRFSPEDVEVLKTAKRLLDEGFTYEQVTERLDSQPVTGEVIDDFQTEPDTEPEPETIEDEPISAIQSMEFFSQVIEQLTEEHKTALQAKNEHIDELKADKDRLQRQLNYERLPFFRKWFTEPPE